MSQKKDIYFLVEEFDLSFDYNRGSIISLTPEASYMLNKFNYRYKILEDFYDERQLRALEEKYFFEQFKWFEEFDNFLKQNISYCKNYNIPLARANYLRLKYFVDTVIIYSYILSHFFKDNLKIKEVVYIHIPYIDDGKYSIFEFKQKNRKVFRDLLGLFCKKYNIRFDTLCCSLLSNNQKLVYND